MLFLGFANGNYHQKKLKFIVLDSFYLKNKG